MEFIHYTYNHLVILPQNHSSSYLEGSFWAPNQWSHFPGNQDRRNIM